MRRVYERYPVRDIVRFVKLFGAETYFASITDAYAWALSGTSASFQATSRVFGGNVTLDRNVTLSLTGGFDDLFATNAGLTVIQGILTVEIGSLTVGNMVVE